MTGNHRDGDRFVNANGFAGQPFTRVPRMLLERRRAWPRHVEQVTHKPPALDGAAAVVTFIGHATFLIQTAAGNVITDPMYSNRAGPFNLFGPRRVRRPAVRFEDLPPISIVLLSHNHYDHCDVRSLGMLAERDDPTVVTPLGNGPLVRSAGIRRVEEIDWWQQTTQVGLPITATPAQHFSARSPFDKNRALWSGFVFTAAGKRIYFAGDTGYAPYFSNIRERLGPIDLALLPIGAYEPRWFMRPLHMNPAEAVQAHIEVGALRSIAMHFGTFQLTTEGFDDPLRGLEKACTDQGIPSGHFRAIGFGDSIAV